MRQEAPLDSGLAGFFAFMGELTCHWRSLVYTKAMKSETINQEEANMNTPITLNTPSPDADPAVHEAFKDMVRRELTIMFAGTVSECKRFDGNVRNLTARLASLVEDTERAMRGHGLLNSMGVVQSTGPALDMAVAGRDVAYRNLKVQIGFVNNVYGHDACREVLELVGGLDLQDDNLVAFIQGDE